MLVEDAVGVAAASVVAADSSWPDEADAQRHLGALAEHSVSGSTDAEDAAVADVAEAIGAVAADVAAAADVERAAADADLLYFERSNATDRRQKQDLRQQH